MISRSSKLVLVLLLVLAFSTAASALQPQDALSAREAESIYTVLGVSDLNGLLQYVLSPAHLEMVAAMMPDEADTIGLVAGIASQIPAESLAVAAGIAGEGPFVQVAASFPASSRSILDKVADGSATGADIVTLLLGEGGAMFADMIELELKKGAKGPYYDLMGEVAFAAKDGLLLIAYPATEIDASIGAIEGNNRLSFKRRFNSPDYWLTHMDMQMVAMLAEMSGGAGAVNMNDLNKFFKAPLELEAAFESKPGSFLLSLSTNGLESFANAETLKIHKPKKGGNMFLTGGGKQVLALSSSLAINAADLKMSPEAAMVWEQIVQAFGMFGVTEGELESLLNGAISIALGGEATIMGANIPGFYLALTAPEGVVAKVFGKLTANEEMAQALSLIPLKADGLDAGFTVDPEMFPGPLVLGVMKDTLLVGLLNADSLTKAPELPAGVAQTLENSLLGIGFIDAAGIWNWLRQETANPESLLSMFMDDGVKGILSMVLAASPSVPLVKFWTPEVETFFMEFSIVDVPQEQRLLPVLLRLGTMF
ncbi:MAG: hypothetical protein FWF87_08275 [Synergistaceae bacterium]|nr:hypothetical protein [Synergistaceae bacterium]